MTRPQFARYYLMRLGIGNDLKRAALNSEFPYKLASAEEVQALGPEPQPPEKRKNYPLEKAQPCHKDAGGCQSFHHLASYMK
jgi:hypothetical protein